MLKSVDVSGKLQIKRGQSVAELNPPPGLVLPGGDDSGQRRSRRCGGRLRCPAGRSGLGRAGSGGSRLHRLRPGTPVRLADVDNA